MTYDEIEKAEPALLSGTFAGGAGILALLAANFSLPHSAGLAVGMSAAQALLTRPAVVSPKSVESLLAPGDSSGTLAKIAEAARATPRPDEPAATVGAVVFLAGFLVQLFTGVDMTSALISAAGIAGVQTVATRSRVHSPTSAQLVGALSVLREAESEPAAEATSAPTPAPGRTRTIHWEF